MVERKTLRNVLDEVLSSVDQDDVPGLEGLSALIHRELPAQGGKEQFALFDESTTPEVESSSDAAPVDMRRKAALYLSEATLDDLGVARARLNSMLNDKLGRKPSDSDIVDKALQIVLDEFSEKGMDSTLVQRILTIRSKSR